MRQIRFVIGLNLDNESTKQRELKEKMVLENFKMEIELLNLRAQAHQEKINSINEEMEIEIA